MEIIMLDNNVKIGFSLRSPAIYDITIVGYLDHSWAVQLGMTLAHKTIDDEMAVTVLKGELIDQAALFGVLNGLYNLGYPLLSVKCKSVH